MSSILPLVLSVPADEALERSDVPLGCASRGVLLLAIDELKRGVTRVT